MASIKKVDIKVTPTPVKVIDRIAEASGKIRPYNPPTGTITFVQYHHEFESIIYENGEGSGHSLLLSSEKPFFHEACVYTPPTSELWITSNGIPSVTSAGKLERAIFISRLKLEREPRKMKRKHEGLMGHEHNKGSRCDVCETDWKEAVQAARSRNMVTGLTWSKMRPPIGVDMPNGAVNHPKEGILICAQGSRDPMSGGIYRTSTKGTVPIVTNFHGKPFNSPNDVVVDKNGGIWFTDPSYGHDQGFRDTPQLPEQVYRYQPDTGDCRVVADGFGRPNGICFSPDEKLCYITDTSTSRGSAPDDPHKASTIYAFDVVTVDGRWEPQLINRRVFAFIAKGFPDGIKCDMKGNVYSGCGDGVHVWNSCGTLIGKIATGDWVANFSFGEGGEMFICNETKVWRVQLHRNVRGALLGELGIPIE